MIVCTTEKGGHGTRNIYCTVLLIGTGRVLHCTWQDFTLSLVPFFVFFKKLSDCGF